MPGNGIFRHTVDLFLAFVGTTTLFSIMATSMLLSSLEQYGFLFTTSLPKFVVFIFANF